jgi:hypothetical protein
MVCRQGEGNFSSLVRPAFCPDLAAVRLHDHFTDCQPQSRALVFGNFSACGLFIFLEEVADLFGGYADARVFYPDGGFGVSLGVGFLHDAVSGRQ